ncbi:MAG: GTP 3',8-cyclase MoaA, partial [Litorivicinaceae bacterium]|nr:GTP 3',8-cyclase MoaA [Litorivicinaceae bacterium]
YSKDFCTTCNRLRVSAKGGLHLCLFGDGGHDLRPLLQRDSDKDALKETICELLDLKVAGHGLHEHNTGATPHFASIGG